MSTNIILLIYIDKTLDYFPRQSILFACYLLSNICMQLIIISELLFWRIRFSFWYR